MTLLVAVVAVLLGLALLTAAVWVFFLAVMNLQRARDAGTLTPSAHRLGMPVLYIGLFLDFLTNVTVCTLLFLELPREWLVTARMTRHIHDGSGWRLAMAAWFCTNLLDAFDPSGCHCKH